MNVKTSLEMSKDISKPEQLITEHIDIWTSSILAKSTSGRGSSKKYELYGITKLRELILELAVRGKLVPQDSDDEPASILLERIAVEKAQLIKDKKIKKPKNLPKIEDNNALFEAPSGWCWAYLQDVSSYIQRGKGPSYAEDGKVMVVSQKCIQWKGFDLTPCRHISDESLDKYQEERYLQNNDLLWNSTGTGTVGRINTIDHIEKNSLVADSHVTVIRPIKVHSIFLQTYISSPFIQKRIDPNFESPLVSGSTKQVELNTSVVLSLLTPVPPLAEQHRIVAKVDELMLLCDQLEQQTEASIDAHATLVDVLLATLTDSSDADELAQNWARISEHFDSLFTTEQRIEALKQTVLQLAVMGKLVPQNPEDEPASVLLEKLRKERSEWLQKTKEENPESKTMSKKLKKLSDASAPFEIPSTWETAHLINLCTYLVDCHNKTAPYIDSGIPIIRTSNIREREFCMTGMKYISEETYEYWSRRCPPEPEDIIFTREAPMGEAAIIPKGSVWCLGQRTMLIRPYHKYVSNQYLLLALTEPHLLERASEHAIGSTVKHLRVGDVEKLNIPLPPLAEQHRIVAKVDELMAICNQLKEKLQQSQKTQVQLTDALVERALG